MAQNVLFINGDIPFVSGSTFKEYAKVVIHAAFNFPTIGSSVSTSVFSTSSSVDSTVNGVLTRTTTTIVTTVVRETFTVNSDVTKNITVVPAIADIIKLYSQPVTIEITLDPTLSSVSRTARGVAQLTSIIAFLQFYRISEKVDSILWSGLDSSNITFNNGFLTRDQHNTLVSAVHKYGLFCGAILEHPETLFSAIDPVTNLQANNYLLGRIDGSTDFIFVNKIFAGYGNTYDWKGFIKVLGIATSLLINIPRPQIKWGVIYNANFGIDCFADTNNLIVPSPVAGITHMQNISTLVNAANLDYFSIVLNTADLNQFFPVNQIQPLYTWISGQGIGNAHSDSGTISVSLPLSLRVGSNQSIITTNLLTLDSTATVLTVTPS